MECFLTTEQEAIAFLRERGYRVTKPTAAKAPESARKPAPVAQKLNAVGKPYGASYDPNYRIKHKTPRVPYGLSTAARNWAKREYEAAMIRKHGSLDAWQALHA